MMTLRLCRTGTIVRRRVGDLYTHLLPFLSSSPSLSLQQRRRNWSDGMRRERSYSEATRVGCTPSPLADIEEVAQVPLTCPGCGIRLQQTHPNRPGYYRVPKTEPPAPNYYIDMEYDHWREERGPGVVSDRMSTQNVALSDKSSLEDSPSDSAQKSILEAESTEEAAAVVCERCHSLRHHGKLKNMEAEAMVPQFSVERILKPKIAKTKGKKVVIVCVVDLFDFDSSLPVKELKSLFPASVQLPDFLHFILVGNKVDLISKKISRERLEIWVRTHLKEAKLPFAKRVHLVSSQTMLGMEKLMIDLRREIVRNTDCYIIGMQNAGKSTMLNALRRLVQTNKAKNAVTTASLPGTTLGFVDVPGIPVPKSCRVFDTPGLQQSGQITGQLTMEELKLVQPRKVVKPRTYRFGVGSSLLIGGLVRLDVIDLKGRTLYITLWASEELLCFLGKTEDIENKLKKHRGSVLRPPACADPQLQSAGPLIPQRVTVTGDSWKFSSTDVCIAGLGWLAVGCEGEAQFDLWTLKGVRVTTRPAWIRDYASVFQRPGFSDTAKSRGVRRR